MLDFIETALPWIVIGVCVVVFLMNQKNKKKSYEFEGLFIGMSLGCALGSLYANLSLGLALGMIVGLAIGSSFQKKE